MSASKQVPKRSWIWSALLFWGAIFYLTLYPFHFSYHGAVAWHRIDWKIPGLTGGHHSRADLLGNIALFVPLGFSLGNLWAFLPASKRFLSILLLAGGTAFGVEALQTMIPERCPALIDALCNTLGALLGAALVPLIRLNLSQTFKKAVLFLGTAFFLLYEPFQFSLDWGKLKSHFKALSFAVSFPNLLIPALLVSLGSLCLTSCSFRGLLLCLFWASVLEGGRVLVPAVSLSVGKASLRVLLSAGFYCLLCLPQGKRRIAWALFGLSWAFLLEAWYPFHFTAPTLSSAALLPFFYYLAYFTEQGLWHLLGIVLFFTVWGVLAQELWPRRQVFLGALLLSFLAEAGQAFVAGRFPDATGVVLALLGVWLAPKIVAGEGL